MTRDKPLLGILLMLAFCMLAPLGDAIAKLLGETIPLLQLLLVRFAVQMLLLPFVGGRARGMSARIWRLTIWRTLLHIAGIGFMFVSLRYLPLADAVAIAFVMPFILLLLGKYVLAEVVGPRRLGACIVGFAGTLLVIQPSFVNVGWPALLPLIVAVVFALFMLVTRQVAQEVDALALQAISGTLATAMLLVTLALGTAADLPFAGLVWPTAPEATLLLGIGLLGTFAHLLMTWSLRYAPAATLAPMQYLEIPMATLVGWVVFSDLPNGLAALGILITVAAGLYIIARERAVAKSA
ncbi:MAG: DMT family transporter [Pseudomonadota bacterium]